MSIRDFVKPFTPKKRVKINKRCSYGLTELGKTKAESFSLEGPTFRVLCYLDENGPSSSNEIAQAENVGLTTEKVRAVLASLLSSGYITPVVRSDLD